MCDNVCASMCVCMCMCVRVHVHVCLCVCMHTYYVYVSLFRTLWAACVITFLSLSHSREDWSHLLVAVKGGVYVCGREGDRRRDSDIQAWGLGVGGWGGERQRDIGCRLAPNDCEICVQPNSQQTGWHKKHTPKNSQMIWNKRWLPARDGL